MALKFTHGILVAATLSFTPFVVHAQDSTPFKIASESVYCGIEVGSKGVKMSILEIGKNAQSTGAFKIIKDTSSNTDFISFTESTFSATLNSLAGMYEKAASDFGLSSDRIFTVISSGVKNQAEKENKTKMVSELIDSFRVKINEPKRPVEVVSVLTEAKLSHLGIIPESRRYSTFLLDIGSGNTKGGFFPAGNTDQFKLFEINWGTKSTSNAAEKIMGNDKSIQNFDKQLQRVLFGAESSEIIYAVNSSGAYPLSDNIAVSGGIAWATATLMYPDLLSKPVITVNFDDVVAFHKKLLNNYEAFTPEKLTSNYPQNGEKEAMGKAIKTVNKVFDQKAMIAGTGLLIKIMRQFVSTFETKKFYLIKNGQVGWVSAYVDQTIVK